MHAQEDESRGKTLVASANSTLLVMFHSIFSILWAFSKPTIFDKRYLKGELASLRAGLLSKFNHPIVRFHAHPILTLLVISYTIRFFIYIILLIKAIKTYPKSPRDFLSSRHTSDFLLNPQYLIIDLLKSNYSKMRSPLSRQF